MAPKDLLLLCLSIGSITVMVQIVLRNEPITQIDRALSLPRRDRDAWHSQ